MPGKKDRFRTVYTQGVLGQYRIIVDTETRVNYLFCEDGAAGGLTVLLDENGKPVITPTEPRQAGER